MAESRSGLLLDIGFELLPELFACVYFAAAATNGDQLLELANFFRKPKNSIRHAEPHLNGRTVDWLRQKVVNAGLSGEDVVFRACAQRGQENEICVRCSWACSHPAAKLQAVHSRHHPIADHHSHRITVESFPRFSSGTCDHDFVAYPFQSHLEDARGNRVIFGDQNFHTLEGSAARLQRHDHIAGLVACGHHLGRRAVKIVSSAGAVS
jgi:hypothetical protein